MSLARRSQLLQPAATAQSDGDSIRASQDRLSSLHQRQDDRRTVTVHY